MKKYLLIPFLTAAVLAAGLWMPSRILEWQDQKKLGYMMTETAEEVVLTSRAELSIIEKLQLMQKDQVISLPAEGKNYTEETIFDAVSRELETLANLGIISRRMAELYVYDMNELNTLFFMDMDDSSRSMRVWFVNGSSEVSQGYILIDDDTGKILSLSQWEDDSAGDLGKEGRELSEQQRKELLYTPQELEKTAEKWGEYLGCTLVTSATGIEPGREKEQEAEIEKLIKETGMSREAATQNIMAQQEALEVDGEHGLYAVYEDEHGKITYLFQKEMQGNIFSALVIE